jgi:hypothetical protein
MRHMTAADTAWLTGAQRIVDRRLPARREARLRYAMGKYLDDIQQYADAFGNYQRANELTKLYTPRFDPVLFARHVDSIIEAFGSERMARAASIESNTARAVFIVGMPRSGTSLAEQILASHPAVFGAGELSFWGRASAQYDPSLGNGGRPEQMVRKLSEDYLQLLGQLSGGASRVIDKMPANFQFLGIIHKALPAARIIHMRRHPIDTCLSAYFQDFEASYAYANDLDDLAHYYRQYIRVMAHWRAVLPREVMLEVPYEGLVADQESWSRRMLAFAGLPWDAGCLDFHSTARTVTSASRWQVRQRMNPSSVERWRNYEQFVGPLLGLAT